MKFIFAPDSFKGSMSALEIVGMLSKVAKKHFPEAETICVPVADGGEGTVDALVAAVGGEVCVRTVTGPMSEPVQAKYGLLSGGTAILEMAQTSGLPVARNAQNPMKATSAGLGELITYLLDHQITKLLIGIGGSATNDCGMGMLSMLGAKFYDANEDVLQGSGEALARVKHIELDGMHPALRDAEIQVICDVSNPLLGPSGATAVYGPQKGVTQDQHVVLEAGMAHFSGLVERVIGRDISTFPGSGAAGGMGAALGGILGAQLKSGIDVVLDIVGFDDLLDTCDLVITGEGRLDRQSVDFGKVPTGVSLRCARRNVPVIAIVGSMGEGSEAFCSVARSSIMTTINAPMNIDSAMENAKELFMSAADRAFRIIKIGFDMNRY